MIKIVAIIPSLCSENAHPILKRCIDNLMLSAADRVDLKIVIVTNGKNLYLKGIRNRINLLIKVENPYSFAKMNNIAIDKTLSKFNPDWILLINDDAYIKKTFFKYFTSTAVKKKKTDLVVPLIYDHKGPAIDSFGVEYFNSGHPRNSSKTRIKTQLVAAACLLISTDLLKLMKSKYGFYFNDFLVSYLEDVEFSIRAMALGAKTLKVKEMIAYHEGSFTNGKKSKYVMYQSYRNLIWLIIMTWPLKSIVKNIFNITIVQLFMFTQSLVRGMPWTYLKIWPETAAKLPNLIKLRQRITGSYSKNFDFENILSPYAFRTNHNIKIKILNIV